MGVPEDISIFIKKSYNINRFVETGTFHGDTSVWASQHFKQVDTIEFSKNIYLQTKRKYEYIENINFIFGDSKSALKNIILNATEPILFWLDAHWCSMGSYGENDQCPLIEELEIINASAFNNFIFIDDARLFMAPPPLPSLIKFYPTINKIVDVSKKKFLIIFEDVIFVSPLECQEKLCRYLQEKTTKIWNDYGENIKQLEVAKNQSRFSKTKRLIKDIINIWKLK
jgi:hypothetical protein